jgi:hypothetical protein
MSGYIPVSPNDLDDKRYAINHSAQQARRRLRRLSSVQELKQFAPMVFVLAMEPMLQAISQQMYKMDDVI